MKKIVSAVFVAFLLAACSSPVLKWIDTPIGGEDGLSGQSGSKEIVSFSFGKNGEMDLPFGKSYDRSGGIPISIILPQGTGSSLTPTVKYIGKSLNPSSGTLQDFSSPVAYTVIAEDNSSLNYIVRVYERGSATKAIVRFALDVSQTGGSVLAAEGIISEEEGIITVNVPAETVISSLTAHVAHTGELARDPRGGSHPETTFTFNGDFSASTTWTVIAQDNSEKTYIVSVVKEKSDAKEIKQFSLGIPDEKVVISGEPRSDGKYPILVIVPQGTPLTAVKNVSVNHTGVSISPGAAPAGGQNFTVPVTYTVAAENHSTRDYEVTVIENIPNNARQISGFYFMDPLVEGVIDEIAHTIALTVPEGTNLSALRPEIYYNGDSVNPISGQPMNFTSAVRDSGRSGTPVTYTVRAQDGSSQAYAVSVFIAKPSPVVDPGAGGGTVDIGIHPDGNHIIIVENPVYIDHPTININYPGSGQTININNNNVVNIIRGDNNEYVIIVNPPSGIPSAPASDAAQIDAFFFTSPVAVGEINQGAGTIDVTVPYGTELRNLIPTICYTGKEIAGTPGASPLKDNRGTSFLNPVDYTVRAQNGTTTKTYTVRVTPSSNPAKEITAFYFNGINPDKTTTIIGAQPNADGKYPIEIMVPSSTALHANLTPKITYSGVSIKGPSSYSDSSGPGEVTAAAVTFSPTASVDYTVTAQDGTTKTYAVMVRGGDGTEADKEITGFYFDSPLAVGAINQNTNTVTVAVPTGTSVGSLSPAVYFKGKAVKPGSGAANDFSGPVVYTVTAKDGTSRPYTVTVYVTPSGANDITRFDFPGIANTETVIGAIPDTNGNYPISVWVPSGTVLDNLVPAITHTGAGIDPPERTFRNFNVPQSYTVTAENGTTKTYTVTVNALDSDAKIITSFVFSDVPLLPAGTGGSVRVVGSIDQNTHTITMAVPYTADVSNLAPNITYIGKLIAEPGGADQTANPFTGTPLNFSATQTYTVKDRNGSPQNYTVTVIRQAVVNVSFEGEIDYAVIAGNSYNQSTGVVTVTVNNDGTTGVAPPYEWYVDGVGQVFSEPVFTLNVGNFTPGRHEIMVSGRKDGLHYTGKVYFVVSK
jgi:hypothetical protein